MKLSQDINALLTGQVEGAIPNGSKVIKQNSEENDAHPNGTEGVVISSIGAPEELIAEGLPACFYFVDWGEGVPIGTAGYKVKEASDGS